MSQEVQLIKNTLQQTKFEDKTVKSTQLSLAPVGLHDFQIFPDRNGACVKRGSPKHNYVQSQSFLSESTVKINISTSGKERFKYPLPWENKISQTPQLRANKDNQIPTPCPVPPPPRRHDIDRFITERSLSFL